MGAAEGGTPATEKGKEAVAFPGKKSAYQGCDRYDFEANGQRFVIAVPKQAAPGKPWLWVAEFFGVGFWHSLDAKLLEKGWHIAYNPSAAGHYGSPKGVANWNACYEVWTKQYGLNAKPVLAGYSRGGLLIYNWAAANPDKVSALYADAPVCAIQSWPGGKGKGKGSAGDWQNCLKGYGLTDAQGADYKLNPIDQLEPLAKAKLALFHVVGDADDVVPVAENTQLIEERYKKLGGEVQVIHKPGVGHHPHALPDPTPIVEFVLKHAP
jgi:pimeloyl-ACP methyl ester carboxylesterase